MFDRRLPALLLLLCGLAVPPPAAAAGPEEAPGLRIRESLTQELSFSRRGPGPGLDLRESRRLLAEASLPLDGVPALDADSLLGLRVGEWTFEGRLGDDPRWRPGRERARLRVRVEGPDGPEEVKLAARWRDGTLALRASVRGAAPLAARLRSDPAGAVEAPVDAAVRLGAEGWRLGGSAPGTLSRTDATVLGEPLGLARITLEGTVPVLDETEDADVPSVAIATPEEDSLLPIGTLSVSGTLGDHRTLVSVTWSLNNGEQVAIPFAADLATGFLTDLAATFDFAVEPVPGRNTVFVTARDAAGNEGVSSVDFAVVVPREVPMAAGAHFALATDASGGVRHWGNGSVYGFPILTAPTTLPGLEGAVALAGGYQHGLALLPDGTVRSWGANWYGQLGYSLESPAIYGTVPAEVPGLEGIVAIAAAGYDSMALRADGAVFVWGSNEVGQKGNGTQGGSGMTPSVVPGLPPCRAIAACNGARTEWSSLFAVAENGDVWGWGDDGNGELCRGNVSPRLSLVPVKNPYVSGVASLSCGYGFVVAVREDGTVAGWGRAGQGQIPGGGYPGSHTGIVQVPGAEGIVQAACGWESTLLLRVDGVVLACGGNRYGQLGNGTTVDADRSLPPPLPAPVPGLTGVARIASAFYTGYAVGGDGSLRCWGLNSTGQVGDGTQENRLEPVLVLLD